MSRERYSPQEQAFYRNYLGSAAWRKRKNARIAQAGQRCEWCFLSGVQQSLCAGVIQCN